MIFLAVLLGILIIFLSIQCIHWDREEEPYFFGFICGFLIFAFIALEILCINKIVSEPHPKAIDVYQGKTTLEYTIRDGVKVDSIVVFKKNYDEK